MVFVDTPPTIQELVLRTPTDEELVAVLAPDPTATKHSEDN